MARERVDELFRDGDSDLGFNEAPAHGQGKGQCWTRAGELEAKLQ